MIMRCLKVIVRTRPKCCCLLLFVCMLLLVVNYFKIVSNFDCEQRWRELKNAISAPEYELQKSPERRPNERPIAPEWPSLSKEMVAATELAPATGTTLYGRNESSYYLEIPHALRSLPHVKNGEHFDRVYFRRLESRFRSNNSLVIGIPTVKRTNDTIYLYDMLNSLFRAIEVKDRSSILVVIFIAELEDEEFVNSTIGRVQRLYDKELSEGLLDIVVPDPSHYPNFKTQTEEDAIFHDPRDRVVWRTKQNYDISYLMAYAYPRGDFYLQLEDDIVTKTGFLSEIMAFIKEKKKENWFMLEFSELGFIGKVFKSSDLVLCINFFLLFASKQPIDLLIIKLLETRACDLNKKADDCHKAIAKMRMRYNTSLFQHVGLKSSLRGKTQPLKDRFFREFGGFGDGHKNPPARISSAFKHYLDYTMDAAYFNRQPFWGYGPVQNDTVLIHFVHPEPLKRCLIRTGNPVHPLDMLTNDTVVEVKLADKGVEDARYPAQSDGFLRLGHFDSSGIFNHTFDHGRLGAVSDVRIKVVQSITLHWILIAEMKFYVK